MRITIDWAIYLGIGFGYDVSIKAWVILLPFVVVEFRIKY